MSKAAELEKIKAEMETNASLPLRAEGINLVFGVGSAEAELVFIGEAPGFHENKHMEPFVGRAGQLLNKLLERVKIPRAQVYITNIVKHRPPGNRDPEPDELSAYKPYLTRELHIIKPKIVATLGRFSMNYFLPYAKISTDHGKIYKMNQTLIYPLYHPAAALRSTTVLGELEKDFLKIPAILKKYDSLITKVERPKEIIETKKGTIEKQQPLF
ncbi:MAG: hypothetical protein A3B23_02070 [Candidatus Colwellbacteria bacterium RIFCSPLOWO2_01_FULL_48_10]|uniref:Type-4 uracil-DNA glycosylase n=2 Tax=Bacteria candidate phyla TaxID=1783234 RepID=A0A1F5P1J5_9BACT|nr:MAG: hypothetical protein A2846_04450 [Candidatus Doudnabacteria bacterium RIFCSPHIGHO2_01_FULL_49_9]OGY59123.1 MAG: hypothetical protein A3B23_02070 [Candidatus Colwellbacteria bacterium RIFCSPLOWO2_01_FULL_48_10]